MTDKQKIKGILVNFFRQGTNRDYLKSLNLAIEEIEQLALCNVVGRSEQLLALAQYMCQHQNNLDGKTAKDYLQEFLSQ